MIDLNSRAAVNQALEDLTNGNRPRLAKMILQARIAAVWCKRADENDKFEAWKRQTLRVKQ